MTNSMNAEETIRLIQANTMSPESTFRFACTQCGDCCRNRTEPIMITGIDILNIARAKKITAQEAVEKYTNKHIGPDSKLPILTLKERSYDGSCSLLRKGKCSVHESKPIVCRLYPIGRSYDVKTKEIVYFLNPNRCNAGDGKTWTLDKWLRQFHVHDFDEDYRVWFESITILAQQSVATTNHQEIEAMANRVGKILYCDLDPSSPESYAEQLVANLKSGV